MNIIGRERINFPALVLQISFYEQTKNDPARATDFFDKLSYSFGSTTEHLFVSKSEEDIAKEEYKTGESVSNLIDKDATLKIRRIINSGRRLIPEKDELHYIQQENDKMAKAINFGQEILPTSIEVFKSIPETHKMPIDKVGIFLCETYEHILATTSVRNLKRKQALKLAINAPRSYVFKKQVIGALYEYSHFKDRESKKDGVIKNTLADNIYINHALLCNGIKTNDEKLKENLRIASNIFIAFRELKRERPRGYRIKRPTP